MKKVVLLFLGLLAGILPVFAQMMPDSTVQVVAYWDVGDKYLYQKESVKYNIAEGDTTVVEKTAELLEFEVVSADEEKGYRVKVTSRDIQISDPTKAAIIEKMRERIGGDVYYFETSPYGEFQQVLPIEGLEGQTDAVVEDIVDAVMKKNEAGAEIKPMLLALTRQMITPESMVASVEAEISPLFMYHGSRFGLKDEYPIEDTIPVPLTGGVLKMNGRFWVNEELTDDYSVVLQMYKEADEEEARQLMTSFMGGMVQALSGVQKDGNEIPSVEEVFKEAKIEIEDFLFEEIHLDTGWPLEWHFTRRTQVEMEGKSQKQLIDNTIKILFEDEQE